MAPNSPPDNLLIIGCDTGGTSFTTFYRSLISAGGQCYLIDASPHYTTTAFTPASNFSFQELNVIPKISISSIYRTFSRYLSKDEIELLRKMNQKPTYEGIMACKTRHNHGLQATSHLPHLKIRPDRRIPCWRAGRWKSLT